METKELKDFLIKKHCYFLHDDDPDTLFPEAKGTITTHSIGSWLWVKARISGYFTEKWYSRAASERTRHSLEFSHDWIGLSVDAPLKVSRPEELETWALLSTAYEYYEHEPKYVSSTRNVKCSGRWVEVISEDGRVTIKIESTPEEVSGSEWKEECVHETEYVQL